MRLMLPRTLIAFVLACVALSGQTSRVSANEWPKAGKAESVGFCTQRLQALTPFLESLDTSAMMVISHGHMVYQYGDLTS